MEVELVKAHRPKQEKKDMSHFQKFVTEGNEKADSQKRSNVGRRFMAEARAKTMQQEVYAALQCAASFHCFVEEWKDCDELQAEAERKMGFLCTRKMRRQNIEWSGVRKPTSIDA